MRVKRLEIASRMEQSWDLIRICKKTIKEKGKGWKESSESRNAQKKLEIEKTERLERAAAQKADTIKEITEKKILTNLKLLPNTRRVALENEQQRQKRMILTEVKQNMWKKWRGQVPKSRINTNQRKQERLEEN